MTKRTQAQWRELFQQQAESGLSPAAFCRARALCPKYFSLRRRQWSNAAAPADATSAVWGFVPVAVQRSIEPLAVEVLLGATLSLRVPLAVSPRWLVEVLQGLRG